MARILHLTDTHLGVDRHYRGAPAGWRRADDHRDAMAVALAPALRGEVDAVIHSGDLFDRSHPPPRVVAEARGLIEAAARHVPVVLLPGNHDRQGLDVHLRGVVGPVILADRPEVVTVAGVRLGLLPWLREPEAWREASTAVAAGGCDLLVAHQGFVGAKVPGFTFRRGAPADTLGEEHLPPGRHWIACGHLHPRQAVAIGDCAVVHPGSTERTAFAERHETKGYTIWSFGARTTWEHHDLPARPMRVLDTAQDVHHLEPDTLVSLGPAARSVEVEVEAIARGAWVAAWAYPRRQVGLFGPGG